MGCQNCGHSKDSHIYQEGACRPGFACPCDHYVPALRIRKMSDEELAQIRETMRDAAFGFLKETPEIIQLKSMDLIPVSMTPEKPFEERWEAFRLSRGISQETFVASGYGFVEDLEEFMVEENQRLIMKMNELTRDLESLVDAVRDCGLAVSRGEEIRKKRGWP